MEKTINLLKIENLERKPIKNRFLTWVSTTGKAIIILVNVVTIGAFVLRVKFDQERVDLKEKLSAQESMIKTSLPFEREFRAFQAKVLFLKERSSRPRMTDLITPLENSVPEGLSVEEESFAKGAASFGFSTANVALFPQFLGKTLSFENVKEVVLKEAHFQSDSTSYSFKVEISFL